MQGAADRGLDMQGKELRATFDNVLILPDPKPDQVSAGGIVLPDDNRRPALGYGTIVSMTGDTASAMGAAIGDRVVYQMHARVEVDGPDGKPCHIVESRRILAVIFAPGESPMP